MRRLLLFDLDGTLVGSRGVGRQALERAFLRRFGWEAATDGISFAGATDPLIVREVFSRFGRTAEDAAREQAEVFLEYVAYLEEQLACGAGQCWALPGAEAVLAALRGRDQCVTGVLTGNVEAGARLKLEAAGLGAFYQVGAFGDEAPHRNDLLPIALARANARLERAARPYEATEVVVVGDTPRDIDVARAHGARVVAVATGAADRETLASHAPDVLLDDLTALDRVLEALLG